MPYMDEVGIANNLLAILKSVIKNNTAPNGWKPCLLVIKATGGQGVVPYSISPSFARR